MRASALLILDSIINLILGVPLLIFPQWMIELLGLPALEHSFYPSILGGVLIGIGLALLLEQFRTPEGMVGLGLGGAVAINLCGGFVLAVWLIRGQLNIPLQGRLFLWGLVTVLIVISGVEWLTYLRGKQTGAGA